MNRPVFEGSLASLAERVAGLFNEAEAIRVLTLVRETAPDERLALAFLLQLGEKAPADLRRFTADSATIKDLIFCLGASELIGTGLANVAGWPALFERARQATLEPEASAIASAQALNEFKRRSFIEIAIADLLGRLSVGETIAAMSRLADECIRSALALAISEVKAEPIAERFCVLGLGKLGACELNLSSDIDLIYLFDDYGQGRSQELQMARRLGERLTEILAAECFRVDLRLRPGGRSAALVSTVEGALRFYQDFGETWERAALLRARPVGGALALGRQLLAELQRFIYRVYLDFETVDQLRAMKRQIENELRTPDLVERNIKLGRGGIRELEFIVQALVLIYGGRDPRLRTPRTLHALEQFATYGYMPRERTTALSEAYLFLRNVEHKLQVAAGLQVHTLPADRNGLAVLAARLAYPKGAEGSDRFQRDLEEQRRRVAEQFHEMLSGEAHGAETLPPLAELAWRAAGQPEQSIPALRELGFAHPESSAQHLKLLACGPAYMPPTERRRESLERLGPRLLDEVSRQSNPDLALGNLADFVKAVGGRSSFLALLAQHPGTRQVLLRLFASSAYLSEIFIRHPEMIDTLVRSDLARARREEAELTTDLQALIEACDDFEDRLDALRSFRHQEFLRIAIADLATQLPLEAVQTELTLVAEVVLREALKLAHAEVAKRSESMPRLRLCILALGRLGAGEMTYNSDLDLIFVYYLPDEVAAAGRETAARIAQKFIAIMEAPTREGFAYKIDLRLRPSGNAGPLVTSLEGFHQYHAQSSALWERQALVRGRVVAGDRVLGDEVEAARRKFVFGSGLDVQGVNEIAAMCARIAHELGQERTGLNLKQGSGGLVEVEFLCQMMALRYGATYPAMRQRSTDALLAAIMQCGLMPADEIRQLRDDYRFLAFLENRLRIESGRPLSSLPTATEELTPIARRAGFDGPLAAQHLLDEVETRRARIRVTFARCIEREGAR